MARTSVGRTTRTLRHFHLLAFAYALLLLPEDVGAATITASLSDLCGTYAGPGSRREQVFDLGVEFSEITEARLSITFSASTSVFWSCMEIGCTPSAEDLFPGLYALLQDPLGTFPSATGDSGTDLVDVEFETSWKPSDLDRLLDGSDDVSIAMNMIYCVPEDVCDWSTLPTATVSAVTVSVTGVVVPEPGTMVLVATGLLGLAAGRRRVRSPARAYCSRS